MNASPSSTAWLRTVPLAHRGLCADAGEALPAENSLAAFARSAASGVGCELDVRLTRDSVPVVVHDPVVVASDGRRRRVARLTVEELERCGVPTLAAALEVLGEGPVMLELKQPSPRVGALEAAVLDVLLRSGRSLDRVVVASFNPWTVAWFAHHAPSLPRALTVSRVATRTVLSRGVLRWTRPHALSVAVAVVGGRRVRRLRADRAVLCWTVRGDADLGRARRFADALIFEGDPTALGVAA